MQHTNSLISIVSRQMLKNFTKKRNNGSQYWDLKQDIDWQHNIVMDVYQDRNPSPEVYNAVFKVLLEIYVSENEEQAEEFLYDIEPYTEVSDLTRWLHSSPQNVQYLTIVVQSYQPQNGIQALAKAHQLYLQDVGQHVIEAIKEHSSEVQ